jgi:hypothetical protein
MNSGGVDEGTARFAAEISEARLTASEVRGQLIVDMEPIESGYRRR